MGKERGGEKARYRDYDDFLTKSIKDARLLSGQSVIYSVLQN